MSDSSRALGKRLRNHLLWNLKGNCAHPCPSHMSDIMNKLQDCMVNRPPNGCFADEHIDVGLVYNRAMLVLARLMPSHLGNRFHPARGTGHSPIRNR